MKLKKKMKTVPKYVINRSVTILKGQITMKAHQLELSHPQLHVKTVKPENQLIHKIKITIS